jgi:Tfp pilus assembly protein FimT
MSELMVVLAIIGGLAILGVPLLMTYWRAAALDSAARELQAILNSGRQLAIKENSFVCVERSGNSVRYRTGAVANCAGNIWLGAGTDTNGLMTLPGAMEISGATANVIFNYLGAANPAGTYTVRNPVNTSQTLTVTVAASGRVTIP